jgi:hypothetical protein
MSTGRGSGELDESGVTAEGRRRGLLRGFGRRGSAPPKPDQWSSPHERARVRAAERLASPLEAGEQAWLDAHLAECEPCRGIADAYAADRLALRQLRERPPEPPRDLWAKTAARIERESAARGAAGATGGARGATHVAGGPRRTRPAWPLGALSGIAVVVFVMVATAISGGFLGQAPSNQPDQSSPIALASASAAPPSLAVGAGSVKWLGLEADGAFAYNVAQIDVVCRHDNAPECPPFGDNDAKRVTLTAKPKYVYQSPVDFQAVVVGTDASGADAVLVVALPTPDPTPSAEPTASGSTEAVSDPAASDATASVPAATPSALPPTEGPVGDPPTLDPSDPGTDDGPSPTPTESGRGSAEPGTTAAVAILTDVTIVGRSAAYSPDGSWFAFSARPADGSTGPDIYVWRVGDPMARPLTTDHRSVFASWIGGSIVGSRMSPATGGEPTAGAAPDASSDSTPSDSPPIDPPPTVQPSDGVVPSQRPGIDADVEHAPEAFLIDPWIGAELGLLATEWRPAVDPTRVAVVAWQGTVGVAGDGLTTRPATGNLVVHPYHGALEFDSPGADPSASVSASASGATAPASSEASVMPSDSADASPDGSAEASGPIALDFPPQVVASGPILDFDARWDDTGTWLAVWLADPADPEIGRLSLFHFDPSTGRLDRPAGAPQDVTALPGFSIGFGRLAWASPPGQRGEGSRIQIAAWMGAEVGAIESIPVEGAIVVQ